MDIYQELGVKKVINAAGTYTVIGASKMTEATLRQMNEASRWNVEIEQLQQKVHARIAEMTRNEAAYVCNSCSTAIYLAAAACISKHFGRHFNHIPREEIQRCEVIALWGQHIPYDHMIEQLGAKVRFIGYPNMEAALSRDELRAAINENTVCCFFVSRTPDGYYGEGCMNLFDFISTAKEHGLPVLVDGAAQLPPKSNLWRYTEMGADMACFSGGKDLAGPQASGLLVGRKEYMDIVGQVGFPHYSCGRLMKIGREEIVALYCAIKHYMESDEEERLRYCEREVRKLVDRLRETIHSPRMAPSAGNASRAF